jgi:hypothetical protein
MKAKGKRQKPKGKSGVAAGSLLRIRAHFTLI